MLYRRSASLHALSKQALTRPTRDGVLAAHGVVQQTAPLGVIALSPATSRPRAVRSYFVK
jgi:hypothetical protein